MTIFEDRRQAFATDWMRWSSMRGAHMTGCRPNCGRSTLRRRWSGFGSSVRQARGASWTGVAWPKSPRRSGRTGDILIVEPASEASGDWTVELEYVGERTISARGTERAAGTSVPFGFERFEALDGWDIRFVAWDDPARDPDRDPRGVRPSLRLGADHDSTRGATRLPVVHTAARRNSARALGDRRSTPITVVTSSAAPRSPCPRAIRSSCRAAPRLRSGPELSSGPAPGRRASAGPEPWWVSRILN